MKTRSYSELRRLSSFEDRFDYLNLRGHAGEKTFGFDRWMNQMFYESREWHQVRAMVIVRDNGCDLGVLGYEIYRGQLVHHMNPVTLTDLKQGQGWILDPEYLITTTHRTHNAIHYGDASLIRRPPVERRAGDTRLW